MGGKCIDFQSSITKYLSSTAVLNFSTLSSLRSCAASFPVLSLRSTLCRHKADADGLKVGSGSNIVCQMQCFMHQRNINESTLQVFYVALMPPSGRT